MASRVTSIDQLYKGRHAKKLVFQVIRLWNAYNTKKDMELISMDFVALDDKNQAIHCCIRSRFIPDFHGLIKEGCIYSMKNFVVDIPKPAFRVIRRDMFILLDASTQLEEIIANLPTIGRHSFDLVTFGDLPRISSQGKNLCDVIGFVTGLSEVAKRVYDKKTTHMQYVEIEDNSDSRLRLTVWGEEMIRRVAEVVENKHRIWIVTSTIVKVEGVCTLSTSSSTKFYDDRDIAEIQNFISSFDMSKCEKPLEELSIFSIVVSKKEYEAGKRSLAEIQEMIESGSEIVGLNLL